MTYPATSTLKTSVPASIHYFYLIIISCVLFFYGLSSISLTQFIEYYYVESAREMIELGEWLVPHFNYVYRFDKPVLFYWLIAASFKLLGPGWGAARLVSSLMAACVAILTYKLAKEKIGKRGALTSVAILISTPHFMFQSRDAMTDMTLTGFITLALFAYYRKTELKKEGLLWFWLLYPALALATLTKGPFGFIIPFSIILSHLLLKRDWKLFCSLMPIRGALINISIILPWTLAVINRHGLEAMMRIIHVGDAMGHDSIKEPFYYYFQHLLIEFSPWGPLLIFIIIFSALKDKSFIREKIRENTFIFLWFITPLVFLSIFDKKIARYILPVTPASAIFLASILTEYFETGKKWIGTTFRTYAWILSLIFSLLAIVIALGIFLIQSHFTTSDIGPYFLTPALIAGAVSMIFCIKRHKEKEIPLVAAGTIVISFVLFGVHLMPAIDSRPLIDFGYKIAQEAGIGDKAGIYGKDCNEVIFYAGRPIKEIYSRNELKEFLVGNGKRFLIIFEKDYKKLDIEIANKFKIIGKKHRWKDIKNLYQFKRFLEYPDDYKKWVYLLAIV